MRYLCFSFRFAGTVLSIVPVLIAFVALQKHFVKGVAASATKG